MSTGSPQQSSQPIRLPDREVAMSVISRRSRVNIPADVLRAAGLEPGDEVRVVRRDQLQPG